MRTKHLSKMVLIAAIVGMAVGGCTSEKGGAAGSGGTTGPV
jgi:hypothetical protein